LIDDLDLRTISSVLLEGEPDPEAGVGPGRGDGLTLVSAEVLEREVLAEEARGLGVELDRIVSGLPGVLDDVVRETVWKKHFKNPDNKRLAIAIVNAMVPVNLISFLCDHYSDAVIAILQCLKSRPHYRNDFLCFLVLLFMQF